MARKEKPVGNTADDLTLTLGDVMTRDVEVVRPDATLADAAKQMEGRDVGALPVCDGERLVGMVTDRDITVRASARGQDPSSTPVSEAMTAEVAYCYEDQGAEVGARLMEERQIRRLPILDREKRLVGIVSLGDLSTRLPNEQRTGEVLREISRPN
jgi:CBS domain-containing protein